MVGIASFSRPREFNIAYIHDNQNTGDGVATVIRNEMTGFVQLLKPYKIKPHFHIIGATGHVAADRFAGFDRRSITLSSIDHIKTMNEEITDDKEVKERARQTCDQILDKVKNDDVVIYENPLIGYWAVALEALSLLKNEFPLKYPDKDLICRVHDVAEDRPHVMELLKRRYSDAQDRLTELLYPSDLNMITMNGGTMRKIRANNPSANIKFIPNSVHFAQNVSDRNNPQVLKLLGLGLDKARNRAKVITYPVRSLPRKCIEESVLIIEIMNRIYPDFGPFQLALPLTGSATVKSYQKDVSDFIKKLRSESAIYMPVELNEERNRDRSGKMVRPSLQDLINASFAVITTARLEGFGYAFVEPFIAGKGKPVFGRRLDVTRQEFESRGINYNGYLYDRLYVNGRDLSESENLQHKFDVISKILESETLTKKFVNENYAFFERLKRLFNDRFAYIAGNREIINRIYSPSRVVSVLLSDDRLINKVSKIIRRENP